MTNNLIRLMGDGTSHTGEVESSRIEMIDINELKMKYANAKEYYFQSIIASKPLEEIERAEHNYIQMEDIYFKAKEKLR